MAVATRKSYDTRVKYLVQRNLLPDVYRKQIHRSLISKWKREAPDKYVGYELNDDITELYDLMKQVSDDKIMQTALRSFYRVTKMLKDVIGTGREYVNKLKEHKYRVIDAIHRCKQSIGIKKAIKVLGISRSTYRMWAMETHFQCSQSIAKLCNNVYPHQLTVNEVRRMHKLLSNEKYLHWPIISVAFYGLKKSLVKAHPNTWYKYARLMKIKRKRRKKFVKKYPIGIRATQPNEKWHADITEIQTADGKISYIYLVIDNFSRYITSWRVADHISAKIRLETFIETIEKAGIKPSDKEEAEATFITDGGSENDNKLVNSFLKDYPIDKFIALKDIVKSNALIESVNKTIKYDYLFPKHLQNQIQLTNYLDNYVIPDYNNRRPQAILTGQTPYEAYRNKRADIPKLKAKIVKAHKERICYNQEYQCLGCPFNCKTRQN
jgi:putative transposase